MKNSRQSKPAKVESISFLQGWDIDKFPNPKCKNSKHMSTNWLQSSADYTCMQTPLCTHASCVCVCKNNDYKKGHKFESSWRGHRRVWSWKRELYKKRMNEAAISATSFWFTDRAWWIVPLSKLLGWAPKQFCLAQESHKLVSQRR